MFIATLIRVGTLLAYAVPGFLFIKTKALKSDAIPAFAKLLLYVCSPCLSLYSFSGIRYTPKMHGMLWICFGVTLVLMVGILLLFRLILYRKFDDVRWRIFTVATALGNVGFFGVPLLEYFLPDHPEALAFSQIFSLTMNLVVWTLGLFIISRNKKYMRPMKILTVPVFLAMLVAYPMFLFGWSYPAEILELIALLGRMSTPLCMIILGMRLATVSLRSLFTDWRAVLSAAAKMVVFPLFALLLTWPLPIDAYVKASIFLLACCPCATMIQSLSELIGQGQKQAANTVLIGTLLCVVTIPVMSQLFLPLILK